MLYRMTLVDSLISAFLVCLIYSIAPNIALVQAFAQEIDITIPEFDLFYDGGLLIWGGIAFFFAFRYLGCSKNWTCMIKRFFIVLVLPCLLFAANTTQKSLSK